MIRLLFVVGGVNASTGGRHRLLEAEQLKSSGGVRGILLPLSIPLPNKISVDQEQMCKIYEVKLQLKLT